MEVKKIGWKRGKRKSTANLAEVGVSFFHSWDQEDPSASYKDKLADIATNREKRRSLSNQND